ncbi:hypothetical protein CEXT_221831 [Caerostris extrusa]|uniref:Uncharacterized protein n=1 Tax=Caerostris extrusa TaxID=172846 RepID=A0AAV4M9K2_CAEEX|nr:hypothetical protein CEXT_221831 [Caerostris extrusa]
MDNNHKNHRSSSTVSDTVNSISLSNSGRLLRVTIELTTNLSVVSVGGAFVPLPANEGHSVSDTANSISLSDSGRLLQVTIELTTNLSVVSMGGAFVPLPANDGHCHEIESLSRSNAD